VGDGDGVKQRTTVTATADPYGMTNKRTGNDNRNATTNATANTGILPHSTTLRARMTTSKQYGQDDDVKTLR
jgi:hypothetical protein